MKRPLNAPAPARGCVVAALLLSLLSATAAPPKDMPDLRIGLAMHAFDHLGAISGQAEIAAASGATVLYASGLGGDGYLGLPSPERLLKAKRAVGQYTLEAHRSGIWLVLGYVCATSIVKLDTFDEEWPQEFRQDFRSRPAQWLQQGRDGKPLPSWYGGDYAPACMNHPDWRNYEKFIVRQQIETGHDGIFFDNPTVHPQGCYCPYCMEKFAAFLKLEKIALPDTSLESMRRTAVERKRDFLRFRCTIARDFLSDMRAFARALNRRAIVTCNNSLNSPESFYSQCSGYAYNISQMSQAEDLVVVEDMNHQPRVLGDGTVMEYGHVYRLLHSIAHGKPVAAVTIAESDYHTPPRLARLAMAEAAANNAAYICWPTWPEKVRPSMVSALLPQADLLRQNEALLNDTQARRDAVLFLPFRRWLDTNRCVGLELAAALSRANIQFDVRSEEQFDPAHLKAGKTLPVLVIESRQVLTEPERQVVKKLEAGGGKVVVVDQDPDWLASVKRLCNPSITLQAPATVRAVVRDQPKCCLVHLLNLHIERISSFEDIVHPAEHVRVVCRVPFARVGSVWALTADEDGSSRELDFTTHKHGKETQVEITVPRLEIATILKIEP